MSGYERRIGRYCPDLARGLIAVAGVQPGVRVLDFGCGAGALTAPLVALVGAGNVVGVDPDPDALALATRRLPGVRLDRAAAEALPYGDGEFDVVLAQLVVTLMGDAPAGVAEMRRVARPGGVVATCVWDFAAGMTVLRAFWDAAAEIDPAGAAASDQAATRPYNDRASLEELWRGAGLEAVTSGELVARAAYTGFDDAWEPLEIPDGGPGVYLRGLAADQRTAIREAFRERLGRPAGPFELAARAWYAHGVAP